jgi:hypothetical protein
VSHTCRNWTSFRIHCAASALETIRGVRPLPWGWWGFPVSGMGRWSLPSLLPAGTVGGPQTLPKSFRPSGPLSGYLIFLTKRVPGVSRTITHRGDWFYSAPGRFPFPPPPSLAPPTLPLCLVLSDISPPSPAASRRVVGSPLFQRHPLYILYIFGCLPPSPLSFQYKQPFPYALPSPFIVFCGTMALHTGCRS